MVRRFLAALFAALARANSALRGAYGFLHDAVEEAVAPVADALPWLRDRAADAGQAGVSLAAGILALPGAVLSGILPRATPGPQAVADDAVARDECGLGNGGVHTADQIFATHHRAAAAALRDGGEAALKPFLPYVPEGVVTWLRSLDRRDLDVACQIPPAALVRHANANRLSECTPMLPPPLHLQPKVPAFDVEAVVREAKKKLAGQAREIEAMSRRNIRPLAEPTWDNEPSYTAPRPAMH
ncbi:hypothetical protein MKK69_22900 [Methylobacterium sp. J-026]|jgi:hypothetical protein|uniref:hypothetical protein n=1 Tax=unclassified Methylobacterium TaxID=2615210 RepID=UPI0011CA2607|nr:MULTISPECIES: hypothetical protein [unclassified Methylobacterium]MCJ2136864.1 hypothetical protein [Methylobacterium sp. J-026]TXM71127.1 hypothetical protein FV229_00150 [Methylobacterium sp. WL120]